MTAPDLAALEAAWEAATPGLWEVRTASTGIRSSEPYSWVCIERKGGFQPIAERMNGGTLADVEWIAMAHKAFPGILAHIEQLEAENERLRFQALSDALADEYTTLAYNEQEARVAELEAQVARVRALHTSTLVTHNKIPWCKECDRCWDCPTIRALDDGETA